MKLSLKSMGAYLLVFIFGWSCAVFSYSDVIYSKTKISLKPEGVKTTTLDQKKINQLD